MSQRREAFEAEIEALIAPDVERVRAGASAPLGQIRDLYPSHRDHGQAPTGEDCVWAAALDAVTSRHGITYGTGLLYTTFTGDAASADGPAEPQIFLVPHGFHGPAEREDRDPAERHRSLGLHFWSNDCPEEALEELREAIRLRPDWADAHQFFAFVLCDSGQLEAGLAAYREALRLDPDDEEKYNGLGCELQFKAGRVDEAIQLCREGLRRFPGSSWLHFRLALALSEIGRAEESMSEYREAIRLDASEAGYHLNLGQLLSEAGRLEEALDEYRKALDLNPDDEQFDELVRETLDRLRAAT